MNVADVVLIRNYGHTGIRPNHCPHEATRQVKGFVSLTQKSHIFHECYLSDDDKILHMPRPWHVQNFVIIQLIKFKS